MVNSLVISTLVVIVYLIGVSFLINYNKVTSFRKCYRLLDTYTYYETLGSIHSSNFDVVMFPDGSISVKGDILHSDFIFRMEPYTYYWYMKYRYYFSKKGL